MSGFFDKIKKFFNLKEMFRLVRGELFKFVKSSTCYVVAGMIIIFLVVTALVYNPESEGWNSVTEFLGGSVAAEDYFSYLNRVDYFTYAERYELDLPYIDTVQANGVFNKTDKYTYLTVAPSVYYKTINPVTTDNPYFAFFEEDTSGFLVKDGDAFAAYGLTQRFILTDFTFYNLFLDMNSTYDEKGDYIFDLFKNNATDAIISRLTADGAVLFDSSGTKISLIVGNDLVAAKLKNDDVKRACVELLKAAFDRDGGRAVYDTFVFYNLHIQPLHSHIYSSASNTLKSSVKNLDRYKKLFYFLEGKNYNAAIVDYVKQAVLDYGEAFEELSEAIDNAAPTGGSVYDADKVKAVYDSYEKFTDLYDLARTMIYTSYSVGVNFLFFMSEPGASIIVSTSPQEYKDFNTRHNAINEEVNTTNAGINENLALGSVYEFISGFYDTLSLNNLVFTKQSLNMTDAMDETFDLIDLSLYVNVGEKTYDAKFDMINTRLDDLILKSAKISKDNIIRKYYGEYYQDELASALDAEYSAAFAAYDDFIKLGQTVVIESGYVNDYIRKQNLELIVDDMSLSDDDLSRIYGIFNFLIVGTSKYSLRSDIAEILFMLDNREKIGSLTTPLSLDHVYGFMIFSFNILYLFMIAAGIIIGAGTIAGEHSAGTIKLLLIRPYKRWQFLMSKILMTTIVMSVIFIVSFGLMYLIGGIFWGFGSDYNALVMFNATEVVIMKPVTVIALMFLFYFMECMIYTLIAIMVSTVFKSKSGAVAVSMGIYFAARVLLLMLSSESWFKYVLFNNSNLFLYMSTGPTLNDMTFGFSLIVDIIYTAIIVGSTFWVFLKKDAN
ncbi:MAG: ABC transporter permease [Clostridiales bacterium]|jgi:ABC-2 type transport system permease protein|nr:ABC transporter permease [Clostridiales bacterium]